MFESILLAWALIGVIGLFNLAIGNFTLISFVTTELFVGIPFGIFLYAIFGAAATLERIFFGGRR